ncbi:glutathione peroxidase [Alphaproteobacteria bacterium]|jgi:glutathione peroxidase|nr:glutathione peroxidase [Alphaproteobacteria bacterium]
MKWLIQIISIITILTGTSMAQNLYNFSINDIDGNVINFQEFQGKPILLVNTASRCGFTKQYANLSNLHQAYLDKNLIIISTPSNSFRQELSEEEDVKEFCLVNYQTKFILTEIIDVKGDNAHPLYQWIANDYGKTPKWNFYKYLFDGQGNLVESWSSMTKPDSKKITDQIDQLI